CTATQEANWHKYCPYCGGVFTTEVKQTKGPMNNMYVYG
ncbi:unnamed protein product, partial [marine sediment metagenome]